MFVFFKPVALNIVHNSFDHIENIKDKDDTPLTDFGYAGASGVVSSPKAGVYDINTYAVPLAEDGDFYTSVNALNGLLVGQKYHVDEIFRDNKVNYYDTAVYIQPNRRVSVNYNFQAEVSNVKFDRYVVK